MNQYVIRRSNAEFHIFPVLLSDHSRDPAYFQADLLIESPDIPLGNSNLPNSKEKSLLSHREFGKLGDQVHK